MIGVDSYRYNILNPILSNNHQRYCKIKNFGLVVIESFNIHLSKAIFN